MRLTDTHSHLYSAEFDQDREEAFARARTAGVAHLLLPAIDSESHEALFDLCRRHPGACLPMMGLHPTSINDNPRWREELELAEHYLKNPPADLPGFCAVGEIGLDFYWSAEFRDEQTEAFRRQCRLAVELDLPVAIHTRNAWPEMLALIEEFRGSGLRGVFHAFADTADTYRRLCACGDFLFGIGGVVTFKKSALADTVREMDPERLLLETDCPYLTPAPHRGERNESAYVRHVCDKVADLKGLAPELLADITTRNAKRMFKGL
ncbi:MAG: TatD family hydrolase [Alistipes sp.]|nr:TatD family hydrolase [Alistipes sp.]